MTNQPDVLSEKNSIRQGIYCEVFRILDEHMSCRDNLHLSAKKTKELFDTICDDISDDLLALCQKDPASRNLREIGFHGHRSFLAVMYYRIANNIYKTVAIDVKLRVKLAKLLSEKAKIETGTEIHPAAKIGKRFVVDHGTGTVIGETCVIGDDCYILENVILGARGIANNPLGKRHPTLGNNVQIGGFARILGDITIGNNVVISPHCVVTDDIPNDAKVVILNQLQVIVGVNAKKPEIYGVIPISDHTIKICGDCFSPDVEVSIVDANHDEICDMTAKIIFKSKKYLYVKVCHAKNEFDTLRNRERVMLKIKNYNGNVIVTANAIFTKVVNFS